MVACFSSVTCPSAWNTYRTICPCESEEVYLVPTKVASRQLPIGPQSVTGRRSPRDSQDRVSTQQCSSCCSVPSSAAYPCRSPNCLSSMSRPMG